MDSVVVEDDEMMHEKHLFMGTKFEGEQLTKDVDHHVCDTIVSGVLRVRQPASKYSSAWSYLNS